jgi:hypothetical protein
MGKRHFLHILFCVLFLPTDLVKGLTCSPGEGVNPYGLILTSGKGCSSDEALIESEAECREAQILNQPTDNNKGWDLTGGSQDDDYVSLGQGIYKEDYMPYGCFTIGGYYALNTDINALGNIFCDSWSNCICKKTICSKCPVGYYSEGGIEAECVKCKQGKYQDETGQSGCKSCDVGKTTFYEGAVECDAEIKCSAGSGYRYVVVEDGLCNDFVTVKAECKVAQKINKVFDKNDRYDENLNGDRGCRYIAEEYSGLNGYALTEYPEDHGQDYYCSPSSKCVCKSKVCSACPKGYYSLTSINSTCTLCPTDKPYTSSVGSISVKNCSAAPVCPTGYGIKYDVATDDLPCKPNVISTSKECEKAARFNQPFDNNEGWGGQTFRSNYPKGCFYDKYGKTASMKKFYFNTYNKEIYSHTSICDHKTCALCPTGHYSLGGENVGCKPCEPRSFNDELGSSFCKPCPYSPSYGAKACCAPGTYVNGGTCMICPQPEYCLGGTSCKHNRIGLACMLCEPYFHAPDGTVCIPCPESAYSEWITLFVVLCAYIILLYEVLKENFTVEEETGTNENQAVEEETGTNENQANTVERRHSQSTFQSGAEETVRDSNHMQSVISILSKHALFAGFTMPLMPFTSLPPALREILVSMFNLFTFDVTSYISSFDCEEVESGMFRGGNRYAYKTLLPLGFLLFFCCWYVAGQILFKIVHYKEPYQKIRSFKNQVIGVAFFLWVTSLYGITTHHTFAAFDCTQLGADEYRLDMDPSVSCNLNSLTFERQGESESYFGYLMFGILNFALYIVIPTIYYCCKKANRHIPPWEDKRSCPNYKKSFYEKVIKTICSSKTIGINKPPNTPCYDCNYCDYRQRYSWFYTKYHSKCFNYEVIILLQKILVCGISTFFTTRQEVSLPSLITLNVVFIVITAYFQPYLTDREYLTVMKLGRQRANINRNKSCSKRSLGINNALDIVLLTAETLLYMAALITQIMKTQDMDPSGNAGVAIFEYLGLFVFLCGYFYFLKHIFIGVYNKVCKLRKRKHLTQMVNVVPRE